MNPGAWAARAALALLAGCTAPRAGAGLERFEFVELHMGCMARVVLYAPGASAARSAARAAFDELGRVDAVLSDWRADSEVARLAATDRGESSGWDPLLLEALERAREVSEQSGGAFDVTIGPLVGLWRDARRDRVLPEPREIAQARELVDWQRLTVDHARGSISGWRPGMRLDFGGIGQGIGADRALAALRACGIASALVEVSGDLALGEPPPAEPGWRVAVGEDRGETLLLARCGVTTSGDTEQFVELGGKRWSHVVDARTGWALETRAFATVIAPDATTADALATAMSVLGLEAGIELAERLPGVEARIGEQRAGESSLGATSGYSASMASRRGSGHE